MILIWKRIGVLALNLIVAQTVLSQATGAEKDTPATGIFVVDIDGQNLTAVSHEPGRFYGSPAWSHDGKKLVFISTNDLK